MFLRGGGRIFEFKYNDEGKSIQAQSEVIFDLTYQEDIDNQQSIKAISAYPGIKDVEFDPLATK